MRGAAPTGRHLPELVADDLNVHLVEVLLAHTALEVWCERGVDEDGGVEIRDVVANAQSADGIKPERPHRVRGG